MIYCFDTYYFDDKANTACIGIKDWESEYIAFEQNEILTGIQAYESGSFYKRELPCIISLLKHMSLDETKDIIIVDGYVILDDHDKKGLGGYLYEHLERKIPIIGVAKNNFYHLKQKKREVIRGESKKPLYISSLGIDLDIAAQCISSLAGPYRMPNILKMIDQNSRKID